ncbi:MAG: glycosyltransferase family 2 protein [Bacteroidota bacterium]
MSSPLFSVIIPTYNRAKTITNTLNSVMTQQFQDFEVLIVDNDSTDNIEEVLADYIATGKVRFFRNDRNYERSYSRNRGLDLAKGDYAILLDSDDLLHTNCLQDAKNFIDDNVDNLFFHNLYEFVDENNNRTTGTDLYLPDNPFKSMARGNFLACNGVFMARSVYQKHRFDLKAVGSEDWDYWLRVLNDVGYIGRINKVNSAILIHSDRSMQNMSIKKLEDAKNYILSKVTSFPQQYTRYKKYYPFMKASTFLYLGSMSNSAGKHTSAIKYAISSIFYRPGVILSKRFFIILIKGIIRSQ